MVRFTVKFYVLLA